MLPRCSSALSRLRRGAVVALLAGGLVGLGATAATAAEDAASDVGVVPVPAALPADGGWIEDVRAASADSTAAVAGGAVLLVAGGITAVAARPRRTPPAQG